HFSKSSHLDFLKFLKAIVRSQIIIENNLKALGFIEQKTPKEDVFKEEDLISEILTIARTFRNQQLLKT
ncbi:3139_t:CDS:2, partial [Funneliformis caledonium]